MNTEKSSRKYILSLLAAILVPPTVAAGEGATQLEEIVVTAQRHAQNLHDVGLAITAFTSSDIQSLGLTQPVDLAAQTPNLNINNTFQNVIPNVSIRGIGLNDYAVNNNPAAGIYIDEVYLVSPAMLSFQLFDIERVEVLKGPQGTLYGRNTTAGTVTFVSKKPTEEFEAYTSVNAGNFDLFTLEAAVSGQIASGLNGRLAVQTSRQNKGHQYNRATAKDVGAVDRASWRGMLNWQPSDKLDVLLNIHNGRDKSDTWLLKVDNTFTATDDSFFPGDPFSSAGGADTFMDIESDGVALTAHWKVSEQLTLSSVTAREDYSRRHVEDRDGTALIQLDSEYLNDIEQLSQEFRLTWSGENLVLIAGIFSENDEVSTRDRFDTSDLPFPFLSVGNEYTQETDSAALFVHAEWQFTADWKLTTGLRYTDEEKEFRDAFTYLYTDALPSDGGTEIALFPSVKNNYDVTDVSGRFGLDYTGIADTLLYGSVSSGFKSGNFQGQLTFNPADLTAFDEENIIAYEAGFKTRLLDHSLQINGGVFFYDYEDVQIYGPHFDSPVGPLFGILNAGNAEIRGAEFDLLWRATEGLDIRLGLGLLDTEITRSVLPFVAKGSELPNSPEINFNTNISYSWSLGAGLFADFMLDASYKDDVVYDIVRTPAAAKEDGYWLVNLRAGVTSNDGVWGVHLWAKNIADKEYRTQVLTSTVGFGESYGFPRTYGIALDYNW